MLNSLVFKKLEQMNGLLGELKEVLGIPYAEFKSKFTSIRTAERDFQLIIELASDINAQIVSEALEQTPDTYRDSFKKMVQIKVLDEKLLNQYIKSSTLRNILIHEYDFDEDNFIFYNSANGFIPLYEEYIKSITAFLSTKK